MIWHIPPWESYPKVGWRMCYTVTDCWEWTMSAHLHRLKYAISPQFMQAVSYPSLFSTAKCSLDLTSHIRHPHLPIKHPISMHRQWYCIPYADGFFSTICTCIQIMLRDDGCGHQTVNWMCAFLHRRELQRWSCRNYTVTHHNSIIEHLHNRYYVTTSRTKV